MVSSWTPKHANQEMIDAANRQEMETQQRTIDTLKKTNRELFAQNETLRKEIKRRDEVAREVIEKLNPECG